MFAIPWFTLGDAGKHRYGVLGEFSVPSGDLVAVLSALTQFLTQLGNFRPSVRRKLLMINNGSVGSRGRTRTYNPTVNSRVLYH
jgi:hypothetical protein